MDPRHQLAEILPLVCELVDRLDEAQLASATPCDGFTVRGVLEHMVGGAHQFAAAFLGEAPSGAPADDDVRAAFPDAMATLQAAIARGRDKPIVFTFCASGVAAGAGKSNEDHLPNVTGVPSESPVCVMREPPAVCTASAIPKSATTACPPCSRMFSGLMSR